MSEIRVKNRRIEHWQAIAMILMIYDIVAVNVAYFFALWLRFGCMYSYIPNNYRMAWLKFVPFYTVFCLVMFGRWWRIWYRLIIRRKCKVCS